MSGHERAAELLLALERCGAEGERVYSDEVLRCVTVRLALEVLRGAPQIPVPPALVRLIGEVSMAAGVRPGQSGDEILSHIQGAMPEELSRLYERVMREAVAESGSAGEAAARLLGLGPSAPVDQGPPPEGSVPAGPLARFLIDKKT